MHGFPLKFGRIRKQMHQGKRQFSTEQEARAFPTHGIRSAYVCPFCCMFHISTHETSSRYEQERWWIIWKKEMETS
jgi:hypothetical protein